MIINNSTDTVITTGDIKENQVRIDVCNIDHIVTLLSTNLYSSPQDSFLRETISNAIDATKEANSDEPIILKFEFDHNSQMHNITIRDYGTGISPEKFQEVYLSIGASTKRNSNEFIGAFGIGKFACLACAPTATIRSFYNGTEYAYTMLKNGTKINIDLLYEQETTQKNGVEVSIQQESLYEYADAVRKLLYFPNLYIDCSNCGSSALKEAVEYVRNTSKVFKKYFNLGYSDNTNRWRSKDYNPLESYGQYLVLGNVIYKYDISCITRDANDPYYIKQLLSIINLKFDVGELDVTPNREQLLYSDKTMNALKERFADALTELVELYKASHEKNYDNLIEYFNNSSDTSNLRIENYLVPCACFECCVANYSYSYKGIRRSLNFDQTLSRIMKSVYEGYHTIYDDKWVYRAVLNKKEILTPAYFCKCVNTTTPNIYVCSVEDLLGSNFKGYLATLGDGLVFTIESFRLFKRKLIKQGVFDSEAIKEAYRYVKDHGVVVTKDENYEKYVAVKKACNSVKLNTPKNKTIKVIDYYWATYGNYSPTKWVPLSRLFSTIYGYNTSSTYKAGVVFYAFNDEGYLEIFEKCREGALLPRDAHVYIFPKTYHKYIEENKPYNWKHVSAVINSNNKKIIKEFTYKKYYDNGSSDIAGYEVYKLFHKYVNEKDHEIMMRYYTQHKEIFTESVKNIPLIKDWYAQFLVSGIEDPDVVEEMKVIKKYSKINKRLIFLKKLFENNELMLAYLAMKNKLFRLNYSSYKYIKDNFKLNNDENN